MAEASNTTIALVAWCNMKAAECDKEVAMAELADMKRLGEPFARDARFFRHIAAALGNGPDKNSERAE